VNNLPKELKPSVQNTQLTTEVKFNSSQATELGNQLSACLLVQKTYGKQGAGDIEPLVDIFISDLAEFKPEQIINAVKKHRQTIDDFPTVASIRAILSPQPKFDFAVYQALQTKCKTANLTGAEWKYIAAYEANAMKGI
jgi:predicted component of type VI protein secretion system